MNLSRARFVLVLCVAWTFISVSGLEAAEVDDDQQDMIGQILLNMIKGERVDYGPTDELLKQFRTNGQNSIGPSWGHTAQIKSKQDGKAIQIYMSITVLPTDYKVTPEKQAQWDKARQEYKDESGVEVAFLESTRGDVRRHRVIYRLVKDGYRMHLYVTRTGDEDAKKAIELTEKGWKRFYKFALEQGLFEDKSDVFIEVVESDADIEGALDDGGVIHIPLAAHKSTKIPLNVWADAPQVEKDKPYTLNFQFKQIKGMGGIVLRDAEGKALKDNDGDGLGDIEVIGGKKGRVVLHVEDMGTPKSKRASGGAGSPYRLSQASTLGIKLTKNKDGDWVVNAEKKIGVQRRDWFPVVQRFQLIGRNWSPKTPKGKDLPQKITANQRISFNDYLTNGGTLREGYEKQIEPLAKRDGAIKADEPVLLGWRVDPKGTLNWFVGIQDARQKSKLPFVRQNVPLSVVLDVKIWQAPKMTKVPDEKDPLDAFGGGAPMDATQQEQEIRRLIFIDQSVARPIELRMNTIALLPAGESAAEFEKKLPQRLRLKPQGPAAKDPRDPDRPTTQLVWAYKNGQSPNFDIHVPMSERFENPIGRNEWNRFTLVPGVYEVRFYAEVYHSQEDRRGYSLRRGAGDFQTPRHSMGCPSLRSGKAWKIVLWVQWRSEAPIVPQIDHCAITQSNAKPLQNDRPCPRRQTDAR